MKANRKRSIVCAFAMLLCMPLQLTAQRLQQPMERGVVSVNRSGSTIRSVSSTGGTGSLISWRKLAQEPEGTTYNVYKRAAGTTNYTKVNSTPLTVTCLQTTLTNNTEYAVTAITPDGVEGEKSRPFLYKTQAYPNVWFNFDFDNTVIRRDDYRTKFCWPMDLDGNGEYDAVVVDRLYAGASDNDDAENQSDNTATTSHKIQAYRLTGELLWTVDMGPNVNICGGQNDMVVAWDINCDGRCEVMIRSCDGTRFWDKENETWGKYVGGGETPDVDGDGIVDYRTQAVRNRPFYVSVIDGATGEEIAWNELKYSEVNDGVDSYTRTSRPKYMSDGYSAMDGHFCICYLDGIHPSLVMECLDRETNKTHHNYVFTWDYDWTNGVPTNWHHSATWSRNDKQPWPAEFHQLRVADVDGDGCDEMIQGGYSVNPLKGWFQSPGIGHGDRFILSDIDPDRPGLEVYAIQQSALLGQLIYDARTAERIKEWYLPSVYDVGRGACMDVDASRKGYELYSFTDDYIYDCKGEKTNYTRSGCGIKQMFEGVWWNGDLQREELSSPGGSNYGTNLMVTQVLNKARLIEFSQESTWATHAANGTRPAFMGDIIGDWREEVILAKQNDNGSTGLVGYTTAMPTSYSIYCLQQDPHYRGDCTTRGYYQHPNTGFYLGGDMPMPPLPPVFEADLRWQGGSSMESGFCTFDQKQSVPYAEGKSLMFDLSGDNSQTIQSEKPFNAPVIYLMNPRGHDYTFQIGTTGNGQLIKSMLGTATFYGTLGHTGKTLISEGTLEVSGVISGPVELRAKGTLAGDFLTLKDTITFEGALNYEGCRLKPVSSNGVMIFRKDLVLPGNVYIETEVSDGSCGFLIAEGDLTFQGTNYITVNLKNLEADEYLIAECRGTLTCDVSKLKTRGLEGINYDLMVEDGKNLILKIHDTRAPQQNVVWTGNESSTWNYKDQNFVLGGSSAETAFVSGDQVIFNNQASQKTINVPEMVVTSGVIFDAGKYVLQGDGGLSGEGGVTVNKAADVTLNMKYSDYTGATIVNGGRLTVPNFYDGGQKSAIGAATNAKNNLQLNGGTLVLSKDNMGTDRQITLTDTATIQISQSSSSLSLKGQVTGTGYLVKDGAGQLNFTYGGTNSFAGLIVKKGIVSQGAWNSTFGKAGSPMLLAGGEVHQIDVNSTSTVPEFNHKATIAAGTTNKIVGSSRGKINGSFLGSGNLTIQTRYVRCDIGANFSQFEGQLTATSTGGNFRLMSGVTDMSKTRLVVDAATTIAHYAGGSGNAATATTKIGSLASTSSSATDGGLGGSNSTYEIGHLNENTTFYGLLTAASIIKTGTGKLTLRTPGHTSPISVKGGTLELTNSTTTKLTTGQLTVFQNALLCGTALVQNVRVKNGGSVKGGTSSLTTGTLRVGGNLVMEQGATTVVQLGTSGNTKISVTGNITHQGDTLLIIIPDNRVLELEEIIEIYPTGFSSATGNVIVKCQSASGQYTFDTTQLNSRGYIMVTDIVTGINGPMTDDTKVDVYNTGGLLLRQGMRYKDALKGLPVGGYIIKVVNSL